jgi:hypothetical protein
LRRLIEPQILRRMKTQVAELPPKKVVASLLPMSQLQRRDYTDAVIGYKASKDKARNDPVVSPFKNHLGLLQYLRSISTMPHAPGLGRFKAQALEQARSEAPKLAWLLGALEQIRQKGEKASRITWFSANCWQCRGGRVSMLRAIVCARRAPISA